jgi:two-component system sensor histidine kinase CpxA
MADKLEKMIQGGKELTANFSHELRTPLARIRVAEELLRKKLERLDKNDWERYVDDIREDIEELDRLIGQILDLSKMDLYDAPLNLEIIDPSKLINQLLERLENTLNRKGLNLTKKLSFDPPFLGDKGALRTALSNILENAVKFTAEKGDMSVKMCSENEWLNIRVTNSSKPMSKEDLDMIFEPFYRAEKIFKKGSGLGLAITKKIVERHGGGIKAVNTEAGLQIQVRLPSGGSV